jgi:hypothetical protein
MGETQGVWMDDAAAAELIRQNYNPVEGGGEQRVRLPAGLGQIINPDGSIVDTSWGLILYRPNGLIKDAYPVLGASQ